MEALLKLQKLDCQLDELRGKTNTTVQRVTEKVSEADEVQRAKESATAKLETLERELRDMTQTHSLEETRLSKSQAKLKQLKTNYEFQALQREIENTKRSNSERQEEITKKTAEVEAQKGVIQELSSTLEKLQGEVVELKNQNSVQEDEVHSLVKQLESDAAALRQKVERSFLSRYDIVRKRYRMAIVPLNGLSCTGCFMNISPQHSNEMRREKKVSSCPNCARLIYYPDEGQA